MAKSVLRSSSSWLSILATQGVICAGAAAAPITVTETINLSQTLTAGGGSATGTFNINSLLQSAGGNYTDPLLLLSASVAVYGYSSPAAYTVYGAYSAYQQTGGYQYTYYVSGSYTYYYSGWNNGCYNFYGPCSYTYYYYYPVTNTVTQETEYATNTLLDPLDSLTLTTAGGTSVSGQDTRTVTNNGYYYTYQYSNYGYNYYYGGNSEVDYYSSVDSISDISNGAISASGTLSANDLLILSQNGTLDYSLSATSGQFTPSSIQLTVTLNESPAVPEPGTLSIFGFSLLLIALRARSIRRSDLES